MSWFNDWAAAARHPRRTLAFMACCGLVMGGLFGYFRIGSIGWAVVLAIAGAVMFSHVARTAMKDFALTGRAVSRDRARNALVRMLILFLTIPVALVVGLAARSATAFVITFACGVTVSVL